jgi:hypothetical protein
MRRRAAVFLLVVLVALAGCSLPSGDLTGATETPGDDGSDEPTPSPTPAFSYPAGYGETGVENVSRALETHRSTLTGASGFQVVYSAAVEGGDRSSVVTYDVRAEPPSERALLRFNVTSENVEGYYAQYYDNDTMYVASRQPGDENTTYSQTRQSYSADQFAGSDWLFRPVLENVSFESSRVATRDGERVVEYSEGRLRDSGQLPTGRLQSGNVTDFSATMVVGSDGYVRSLEYRAAVVDGGAERRLSVSIQVTNVGETTVREPDWIDRT